MDILDRRTETIKACFGDRLEFCKIKNFRTNKDDEAVVQFTANIISLEVLFGLLEHEEIEDVHFHPSVAPHGSHVDHSAMRYRIYVKFID